MSKRSQDEKAAASAAARRAMPFQRLLGNGMSFADAHALHQRTTTGEDWTAVAIELALANRTYAEISCEAQQLLSAQTWWLLASAAERFGQVVLEDGDVKRDMYRRLIEDYGKAGAMYPRPIEHVVLQSGADVVSGWLHLPATTKPSPVVVIIGGFDGWREEYDKGARSLVDRGVGALLIDGPGQGESRLFHESFFGPGSQFAASIAVDHLLGRGDVSDQIGIWGNSFGGHLAIHATLNDSRISACCMNGGTTRPTEILDRYPRFIRKIEALTGRPGPAAVGIIDDLGLAPKDLGRLLSPLLVLHGHPDRVFLFENARSVFDAAGSEVKTMLEWEDGDHCLYNHTDEKHMRVADWFVAQLNSTVSPPKV